MYLWNNDKVYRVQGRPGCIVCRSTLEESVATFYYYDVACCANTKYLFTDKLDLYIYDLFLSVYIY